MSLKRKKKDMFHLDILYVYNELLHYEELKDMDMDDIYELFIQVLRKSRSQIDFTTELNDKLKDRLIDLFFNALEEQKR